jgi:hypothetical protein
MATVGATRHAFVRLSSQFSSWDGVNSRNRVTVMAVLAHELGHVFGFQHTAPHCSLMAPMLDVDGCGYLATSPGYYKCRTIDTTLARRFVRMYGGRVRYPAASSCLIDPLPPVLGGVSATGGLSVESPVVLHWTPPRSAPAGSRIHVYRWEAATCGAVPGWADYFSRPLSPGSWQDTAPGQVEDACFVVRIVNRYGAGRTALTSQRTRWVPRPDVPVIGTMTYDFDTEQFTFPATVAGGATLHVAWDESDPTTCVSTREDGSNSAFVPVTDGEGVIDSPTVLPQCVSFFAHDPETGRDSEAVSVTLTPQG